MAALMALNAPLLEYVAPAMLSTGLPEATLPASSPNKAGGEGIAGDLGADAGGLGGAVDGDTGNGTLGVKGNVDRDVLAGVTGGRSLDGDIAVRGLDSTLDTGGGQTVDGSHAVGGRALGQDGDIGGQGLGLGCFPQ